MLTRNILNDVCYNNSFNNTFSHVHPKSYSFVLSLLYMVIVLVSLIQIIRIVYYRHSLFHYQFGFLVYCFVWGNLRYVFWLFIPYTPLEELVFQGLALVIQFSTFAFLVLFYAQIVFKAKNKWKQYRKLIIGTYGLLNATFLALYFAEFFSFLVSVGLGCRLGSDSELFEKIYGFFIASMYFSLSILLLILGIQVLNIVASPKVTVTLVANRMKHIILTSILALIFFIRSIFDVLSGYIPALQIRIENPMEQDRGEEIVIFLLTMFWDLVPATLVIMLFWYIPGSNFEKIPYMLKIRKSKVHSRASGDFLSNVDNMEGNEFEKDYKWIATHPLSGDEASGMQGDSPNYSSFASMRTNINECVAFPEFFHVDVLTPSPGLYGGESPTTHIDAHHHSRSFNKLKKQRGRSSYTGVHL